MELTYYKHETAIVDEGAVIGAGTKIWHFSHVSAKALIGNSCSLGQNVYVANHVVIGDRVKIQNNVSLYEGVILEDDVFCGPSMVFTNVRTPRSAFPRNTSEDYQKTIVRRGASMGANVTVVCGVTIGEWSFIAAGAVVNRDTAPYSLYAGVPAKRIGWVCECGNSLKFHDDDTECILCHREYYKSDDNIYKKLMEAQ